ncbi:hypothetical protein GALMADRAFT_251206 [Galerina marginata CBS 339.88]|uniref:DUF7918 domain-containing protein n=1 Tax=Galerina marginata (strain CBS 339.88) TaxID=685588 RepID=A0A067STZ0_GALM3|nr:hypothetical protein GALMADRAFT_251206 [Galerina marginata CBS 339.88]
MLKHRGFSAWIMSNGQTLPEYLVAVDETAHRVSCWIPGKEGETFTVYWQDHAGKVDSCAFINLDGLVVPGRFLFGNGVASRGGVRASASTERPFVFQKVSEHIVESPARGAAKDAGMITLKVKRIKRVDPRPANPVQSIPSVLGKRKAGDLCIGFGEEVSASAQHPTTWDVRPYDEDVTVPGSTKPSTYVSFVFRYRSPEFLETQGIAVEETKPTPKRATRQSVRRIASLPPHLRAESDSPVERPEKKPRLMPLASNPPVPFPSGLRRPSAELRRTASYAGTASKPANYGTYEGESQFFLPRERLYAPPLSSLRPPESSGTSESPEPLMTEDSQ